MWLSAGDWRASALFVVPALVSWLLFLMMGVQISLAMVTFVTGAAGGGFGQESKKEKAIYIISPAARG
jgi:hypothetical protein